MEKKLLEDKVKKTLLQELHMTEEQLDQAVDNLKSWLQYQPHLPHDTDNEALRTFIVSFRSVELAKEKLQNYLMARINYSDLVRVDPKNIQWDNIQPMAYLPDLTPEGYLVFFLTMPNPKDLSKFDFMDSVRYLVMMGETLMRERPYIAGQICLVDLKNLSLKLVPKISISTISNALYLIEEAYPFVMRLVVNFHTPQIADSLQRTIIQPIMSDGFYNKIISYTDDERCLSKHVPAKILPKDYGGEAPCLAEIMRDWRVKLENNRSLFLGELSQLPDATKIPAKLKEDPRFGKSGTFRKLDID